jgi:hypothetical protein
VPVSEPAALGDRRPRQRNANHVAAPPIGKSIGARPLIFGSIERNAFQDLGSANALFAVTP